MFEIPNGKEKIKFEAIVLGNAKQFGLTPEDYLRKIWYHEEAAKLGEYVAISILNELLPIIPEGKR